jgi:hypothetical protein
MTNWITIWHACWGALSKDRADAIEVYLADKLDGIKGGELTSVVEALASTWDAEKSGRAPTIGMLIWAIKQARLKARGIDTSEPFEVRQVRMAISHMPSDDLQRWNACCLDHLPFAKCGQKHSLVRWAMQHGGLTVPWWAPENIPHTSRQPKPADWRRRALSENPFDQAMSDPATIGQITSRREEGEV